MPYDSFKHHRRSIRLRGYDYTSPGAYYVTIDTHAGLCLFGEIVGGVMILNPCGQIVSDFWSAIPAHFPNVQLDEFIVMPNHVHGIIMIIAINDGRETVRATHRVALNDGTVQNDGTPQINGIPQINSIPQNDGIPRNGGITQFNRATRWVAPTNARPTLSSNSIGSMIGQFKSAATKQIIQSHIMPAPRIWHRNYHDHIIRDNDELTRIREYIRNNPLQWDIDKSNQ